MRFNDLVLMCESDRDDEFTICKLIIDALKLEAGVLNINYISDVVSAFDDCIRKANKGKHPESTNQALNNACNRLDLRVSNLADDQGLFTYEYPTFKILECLSDLCDLYIMEDIKNNSFIRYFKEIKIRKILKDDETGLDLTF